MFILVKQLLYSPLGSRTSDDRWNIEALQEHSERMACGMRHIAIILAIPAFICLLIVALLPLFPSFRQQDVTWAIVILSELVIPAAFLIFISRLTWDYSNVWLGRAGTLEDLGLALKLMGFDPSEPRKLTNEDAQRLLQITEAIERLQRKFEGDLLKGPSFQLQLPKGGN
jgi:hypothetical protein